MKGIGRKVVGGQGCHPGIHYVKPGEQMILEDAGRNQIPVLGVIAVTPQGLPLLLVGGQVDKEVVLLALLQQAVMERKQREESPLAKAGFVVPPGVNVPVREAGDEEPLQ